jgi:hypothetical protein
VNQQLDAEIDLVFRAYGARNPGALPKTPIELVPYFDPPLGPAMTEMITRPLTPEQQKDFEADMAKRAAGLGKETSNRMGRRLWSEPRARGNSPHPIGKRVAGPTGIPR